MNQIGLRRHRDVIDAVPQPAEKNTFKYSTTTILALNLDCFIANLIAKDVNISTQFNCFDVYRRVTTLGR